MQQDPQVETLAIELVEWLCRFEDSVTLTAMVLRVTGTWDKELHTSV